MSESDQRPPRIPTSEIISFREPLEPETEDLIEALERLKSHVEQIMGALTIGRGDEYLVKPAAGHKGPITYLAGAQQLVDAHVSCEYFERLYPLADEIVQLRADLLFLFQRCSEVYRVYGKKSAARMLEALPPPNDEDVRNEALDLLEEMQMPRNAFSAFRAADQLTVLIGNKRFGPKRLGRKQLTENYVSETAKQDCRASKVRGPSEAYRRDVEACENLIVDEKSRPSGK